MSKTTMGRTDTSETSLSVIAALATISARLTEAAALARAALVCARPRTKRETVPTILDLDVPLSKAQTLHAASCHIGRIDRTAAGVAVPAD